MCTDSEPCKNGGNCTPTTEGGVAGYTCNCTLGYEGENCTNPSCSHGNCENGGNCSVTVDNKWTCSCPRYTTGKGVGGYNNILEMLYNCVFLIPLELFSF